MDVVDERTGKEKKGGKKRKERRKKRTRAELRKISYVGTELIRKSLRGRETEEVKGGGRIKGVGGCRGWRKEEEEEEEE